MLGPREDLPFSAAPPPAVRFGRAGTIRRDAAAVAHRQAIDRPAQAWRDSAHPIPQRWALLCESIERRIATHSLARDLADDIGSAAWLRGLFTLIVLIVLACALRPATDSLLALSGARLEEVQHAELRALALGPWRTGATQGRHYAGTSAVIRLDNAPERPEIRLAAMLGEGDSVSHMLQRAGLSASDAMQAAALVDKALPADGIAPGTRFDLTLGHRTNPADPRPLQALEVRPRFDLMLSVARTSGGALSLKSHPIAVDTTPQRLRGLVGSSLYRAARAAGAPPETVQSFLQTIDSHVPFDAIASDDTFDLVFDYKRTADGQGAAGNLIYAGIIRQGRPLVQLLRWGKDGGYFTLDDLRGDAVGQAGPLLAPVAGAITSGFGMRRHPILGFVRLHAGIDYAANWGAPIYAVAQGAVTFAGWHGGHGNYVRIDHGGGVGTGYGHMSRIAVSPGMTVQRGQVIGYVGSTGLSTGPHLHYEAYRAGQPIDPLTLHALAPRQTVDPAQLSAFRARLSQVLAVQPGILPIR